MMDLSPPSNSATSASHPSDQNHRPASRRQKTASGSANEVEVAQPGEPPTATQVLLTNVTLRKQFAFYAMASNPMNFTGITRSGFLRFAKDCALHELRTPALTDAELYRIFALAAGPCKHMTFRQWTRACELLLHHVQPPQV